MVVYRIVFVLLIITSLGTASGSERCNGSVIFSSGCGPLDVRLPGPVAVTSLKSNCSSLATVTLLRGHRQERKVALQQGERANFFDPPVVTDALRVWSALSSCCTVAGEGCPAPDDDRHHTYSRPPRNNRAVVRHAATGQSETDTGKGSLSVGFVVVALSAPLILTIALAMGCCRSHQEQKDLLGPNSSSAVSAKELPCVRVQTNESSGPAQELTVTRTEPTTAGLPAQSSIPVTPHVRVLCSSDTAFVDTAVPNMVGDLGPNLTNVLPDADHSGTVVSESGDTLPGPKEMTSSNNIIPDMACSLENVQLRPGFVAGPLTETVAPHQGDTGSDAGNKLPCQNEMRPSLENKVPPRDDSPGSITETCSVVVPRPQTTLQEPGQEDMVPTPATIPMAQVPTPGTIPVAQVPTPGTIPVVQVPTPGTIPMAQVPAPATIPMAQVSHSNSAAGMDVENSSSLPSACDVLTPSYVGADHCPENSVPISENPVPISENPVSISENSVPISENSVPISENPVPISENSVPISENLVLTSENSVPISENPVPISENPVPMSENPVPISENLLSSSENPAQNLVPNSDNSVPNSGNLLLNSENSVSNLENSVFSSDNPVPNSEILVPNSENLVLISEKSMPNSENPVSNPDNPVPNPVPNPANSVHSEDTDSNNQTRVLPSPDIKLLVDSDVLVIAAAAKLTFNAINILPRSKSLSVRNIPASITCSLISKMSTSAPDFSGHAQAAHTSATVIPSDTIPEPEVLVHDFICMVLNQNQTVLSDPEPDPLPLFAGSEMSTDSPVLPHGVVPLIHTSASTPPSLDPECLVFDFMRLVCGMETWEPAPNSPVHTSGPQTPFPRPSVQPVARSADCLLFAPRAPATPTGGRKTLRLEAQLPRASSLPSSLNEDTHCGGPHPPLPSDKRKLQSMERVSGSLLPPSTGVQPLPFPASTAPPEEPIYGNICAESPDQIHLTSKPSDDTTTPTKKPATPTKQPTTSTEEPIYHVLEKPCEDSTPEGLGTLAREFGSTESIGTVTGSLSSWSSEEEFDEPVYQTPSESQGSMTSSESLGSRLNMVGLPSSSHASRSSSRAGSCRHVTTPPPTVRCSVEPCPLQGSPTPPPEEQAPPLPCRKKSVPAEHIYESVKVKPQPLSCGSKVLVEEDIERLCRNKMVLELGSLCSSEGSSCDTLPSSPMYVDPVDVIRVGSLGTHLEPPVRVDPWGSRRGSGSVVRKHCAPAEPMHGHASSGQLDESAVSFNPVLPQVALSVEEVWLSQQENLYAPLTFTKTQSLKKGERFKPEEVGWYEKPVKQAAIGHKTSPHHSTHHLSPHHLILNKTTSFSLSDRSRTNTPPLGTSL